MFVHEMHLPLLLACLVGALHGYRARAGLLLTRDVDSRLTPVGPGDQVPVERHIAGAKGDDGAFTLVALAPRERLGAPRVHPARSAKRDSTVLIERGEVTREADNLLAVLPHPVVPVRDAQNAAGAELSRIVDLETTGRGRLELSRCWQHWRLDNGPVSDARHLDGAEG